MNDEFVENNWSDVEGKLLALRSKGYEYLQTNDEAVTWRGSNDNRGVPIEMLLAHGTFRGNIVAADSPSNFQKSMNP